MRGAVPLWITQHSGLLDGMERYLDARIARDLQRKMVLLHA